MLVKILDWIAWKKVCTMCTLIRYTHPCHRQPEGEAARNGRTWGHDGRPRGHGTAAGGAPGLAWTDGSHA